METWLIYAILASLFAGITAVLAKIGITGVNSHLATAIRTAVIVIFSWGLVFMVGSFDQISEITARTWFFLITSGLATGASWLCFFYALKLGTVSQVSPLKKSSMVLTLILAFIILGEPLGIWQVVGMAFIISGTMFMINFKKSDPDVAKNKKWLIFGLLAAIFASLVTILGTLGIRAVEANLGNAIRVVIVLLASLIMVLLTNNQKGISKISLKSWTFLVLSGVTTGASWLFYFSALQIGPASGVVPIDKLSILLNILFARLFLKEQQKPKQLIGLALLSIGTLALVIM